jgi:hypothetical protein
VELWGHQFKEIVVYFKDPSRQNPGTVDDVYAHVLEAT